MASRLGIFSGFSVMTIAVLLFLWPFVAQGYVRFFMDAALVQFLC